MSLVNTWLARTIDALLYPFREQPPWIGLAGASLILALAMVNVVRATSDHARLRTVRRALVADVFEMRLFKDDAVALLQSLGGMIRHNVTYLRLSMVPVCWMVVPIGLLVAQLQFHYGYGGLEVGRPALVKVRVRDASSAVPVLSAPPGVRIETPAVWIPTVREAAWRIAAEQPGDYELTVRIGNETFTKTVRVSTAIVRRSPLRADRGFVNQLIYPAEPPLPHGAPVEWIAVTYPARGVTVLGQEIHWMLAFFGMSVVFALALRRMQWTRNRRRSRAL